MRLRRGSNYPHVDQVTRVWKEADILWKYSPPRVYLQQFSGQIGCFQVLQSSGVCTRCAVWLLSFYHCCSDKGFHDFLQLMLVNVLRSGEVMFLEGYKGSGSNKCRWMSSLCTDSLNKAIRLKKILHKTH